jgi:hypothetical protein
LALLTVWLRTPYVIVCTNIHDRQLRRALTIMIYRHFSHRLECQKMSKTILMLEWRN